MTDVVYSNQSNYLKSPAQIHSAIYNDMKANPAKYYNAFGGSVTKYKSELSHYAYMSDIDNHALPPQYTQYANVFDDMRNNKTKYIDALGGVHAYNAEYKRMSELSNIEATTTKKVMTLQDKSVPGWADMVQNTPELANLYTYDPTNEEDVLLQSVGYAPSSFMTKEAALKKVREGNSYLDTMNKALTINTPQTSPLMSQLSKGANNKEAAFYLSKFYTYDLTDPEDVQNKALGLMPKSYKYATDATNKETDQARKAAGQLPQAAEDYIKASEQYNKIDYPDYVAQMQKYTDDKYIYDNVNGINKMSAVAPVEPTPPVTISSVKGYQDLINQGATDVEKPPFYFINGEKLTSADYTPSDSAVQRAQLLNSNIAKLGLARFSPLAYAYLNKIADTQVNVETLKSSGVYDKLTQAQQQADTAHETQREADRQALIDNYNKTTGQNLDWNTILNQVSQFNSSDIPDELKDASYQQMAKGVDLIKNANPELFIPTQAEVQANLNSGEGALSAGLFNSITLGIPEAIQTAAHGTEDMSVNPEDVKYAALQQGGLMRLSTYKNGQYIEPSTAAAMNAVRQNNPLAYTAGGVLGMSSMIGVGQAAAAGVEALGGSPILQSIAGGALPFMIQGGANSIAQGNDAQQVIVDTLTSGFTGGLGGALSPILESTFSNILKNAPKVIQTGVSKLMGAVGFAGSMTGTNVASQAMFKGKVDWQGELESLPMNLLFPLLSGWSGGDGESLPKVNEPVKTEQTFTNPENGKTVTVPEGKSLTEIDPATAKFYDELGNRITNFYATDNGIVTDKNPADMIGLPASTGRTVGVEKELTLYDQVVTNKELTDMTANDGYAAQLILRNVTPLTDGQIQVLRDVEAKAATTPHINDKFTPDTTVEKLQGRLDKHEERASVVKANLASLNKSIVDEINKTYAMSTDDGIVAYQKIKDSPLMHEAMDLTKRYDKLQKEVAESTDKLSGFKEQQKYNEAFKAPTSLVAEGMPSEAQTPTEAPGVSQNESTPVQEVFGQDTTTAEYIKQQNQLQEAARKQNGTNPLIKVKNEAASKLLDNLSPIERTMNKSIKSGVDIPISNNITPKLDRALRSETIAGQYIRDNGLAKVIQSVPDTKAFDQYLIAVHAADLEALDIKTGRNLKADQKLIAELKDTYEPYKEQIMKYNQELLDKAVEYGLVSKETADLLKEKYPNYVPANRIFNEDELSTVKGTGGGAASISSQTVVQKIKGSERQIESPLASIVKKTMDVVSQGERNIAASTLASYIDLPGNPFELREIKPSETVGTKSTISYLDDGKVRRFETTPEIATAAKALNKEQIGILGKIVRIPTRILRLGATGMNAGFALSNVAKDMVTAAINSEHPLRSSVFNVEALKKATAAALYHGGKSYAELVREGAGGTSFDIARGTPKQNVKTIRADKNIGTKILYNVTHPAELLRAFENTIGRSEEFTRALQYFGNKEAALKQGMSLQDATTYGAMAARTNSTDFLRHGDYGAVLNSAFPYLNAGIQGSRTLLRNIKTRPVQTVGKIALLAILPTLTMTAWNLADPKRKAAYDDIADYEKEGNMIIIPPDPVKDPTTGKWKAIKIPASQEIANLNNIARNTIEELNGDKNFDVTQLLGDLIGTTTSLNAQSPRQLANQVIPQALKPVVEGLTNQNLYTGNQIVPDSQMNLPASEQYGNYTSGTAKVLGGLTGLSPRGIDNFIRTSTGGAGQNAINFSDQVLAMLGVIKPSEVQGQTISQSVLGRFSGASAKPASDAIAVQFNKARDTLVKMPQYKLLSKDEQRKAINRLQADITAIQYYVTDKENPGNGYAPVKLSANQKKLMSDPNAIANYAKKP